MLTREQVGQTLNNLVDHGTVDDKGYKSIMATDATLRAENERLRQTTSVYRGKHAYQWHDEAMANLKAWHEEVDALKQFSVSEATVMALEEALLQIEKKLASGYGSMNDQCLDIIRQVLAKPQAKEAP